MRRLRPRDRKKLAHCYGAGQVELPEDSKLRGMVPGHSPPDRRPPPAFQHALSAAPRHPCLPPLLPPSHWSLVPSSHSLVCLGPQEGIWLSPSRVSVSFSTFSLSSRFLSLLVSGFSGSAFLSAFLSYMAGFPHPHTPARAQSLRLSSGLSPVPLSLPSPPRAPSPCTLRPLSPARPSAPAARSQGPGAGTAGLARRPA